MSHEFFTMDREADETLQDFVYRTWQKANPTRTIGKESVEYLQETAVDIGFGSPYMFGDKLRELLNDERAGIYYSSFNIGNLSYRIYYAWASDYFDAAYKAAFFVPEGVESALAKVGITI